MKKLLWLLLVLLIAGLGYWLQSIRNAPPEISVTKPQREKLVSAVTTNGKVEPLEWTAVRSEREGTVLRLAVEKGQTIAKDAVVAELDVSDSKNELATAEARIAEARAQLDLASDAGRVRELSEIAASIDRAKAETESLRPQAESLRRLVDKKAATRSELDQITTRIEQLQIEIRGLEKRRSSLVSAPEKAAAQAKLREAEVAATQARHRIALGVIHAPMAGTVYQIESRQGGYVRPGDVLAYIGRLDRVRVHVYVDEPEVGAIKTGQAVTITWEALPGREWTGVVEKLPTQITALNSRQVGEVICIIDNPDRQLLPQTNVNASIRIKVVDSALTIPKEALRRERGEIGVFLAGPDSRVSWRKVRLGAANITRVEIVEGLQEGDQLILPTDTPLQNGMLVKTKAAEAN